MTGSGIAAARTGVDRCACPVRRLTVHSRGVGRFPTNPAPCRSNPRRDTPTPDPTHHIGETPMTMMASARTWRHLATWAGWATAHRCARARRHRRSWMDPPLPSHPGRNTGRRGTRLSVRAAKLWRSTDCLAPAVFLITTRAVGLPANGTFASAKGSSSQRDGRHAGRIVGPAIRPRLCRGERDLRLWQSLPGRGRRVRPAR